jgi:hypothetical protein
MYQSEPFEKKYLVNIHYFNIDKIDFFNSCKPFWHNYICYSIHFAYKFLKFKNLSKKFKQKASN